MLLRPLARYLNTRPDLPDVFAAQVARACDRDRIPVAELTSLTQRAAELTGDPAIGLRIALFISLGDFEVLEWVATSAATWHEANQVVCRYIRILNEAADYRQILCDDKSHLMLGSTIHMPAPAIDFELAAYHLAIRLRASEIPTELEVWFEGREPSYVEAYRMVFPQAKLVFNAAFNGFVTDAWRLETRFPTANESLHRVLRAHADHLLTLLANGENLIQRVSADILHALREGTVAAEQTAARLGMTRRTLTRRLAREGTSYSDLLKQARYQTALHYLRHTRHTVEDIAFLVGFSECGPFVRAFKRWNGQSPADYRRSRARDRG